MLQRRNSTQRQKILIRVLSLLLFLAPLLGQAQWLNTSISDDKTMEMPCHQTGGVQIHQGCEHCDDSGGLMSCDCCHGTLTPSLSMGQPRLVQTLTHGEIQPPFHTLKLPEPPPGSLYRPPISLI